MNTLAQPTRACCRTQRRAGKNREHFDAFRQFCEGVAGPLNAPGQLIASWLMHLYAIDRRPLAEVRSAERAVKYFQSLARGDVYVDAVLAIMAETDGGDDGGN